LISGNFNRSISPKPPLRAAPPPLRIPALLGTQFPAASSPPP